MSQSNPPKPDIDVTDTEQLIYHLIRLGAHGESRSAKNVGMLAVQTMHKLKRKGEEGRAQNIGEALTASGYAPSIWRDADPDT